jgi:hypothetical protein|tara:strand:- start:60 stop:269 length:210 start_codon:yes stop_codon:yes gene_type:complete
VNAEFISGVDNNLLIVHICYVIALVYFVFKNGTKRGASQMCEILVEEKVVSQADLNRFYKRNEKDKDKK